jgi:hypothetical protein
MPLAIDTVLGFAVNPGAGPTALTPASGDSFVVRNFADSSAAYLENIVRMGTAAGFVQVRSPLLHDMVRGIRVTPGESPSAYALPAQAAQPLKPTDTLTVEMSGGAAETDVAALMIYYQDLPGASARLHSWGDISGNIENIKPLAVAVTSSATAGQWSDTVITTTEDLLHADTDYAVLGYSTNTALAVVGIRGIDTSNLRVCGPGATLEFPTTEWFIRQGDKHGTPHIPVFNSNNKGGISASVAAATASVGSTVELILAELKTKVTP